MATLIIPNLSESTVMNGLNTYRANIPIASMFVATIRADVMPSSGMTIAIVQTGSVNATLATVTFAPMLPYSAQSSRNLSITANCQPGDTLSFVLTSSTPSDQGLNTVKAILNIRAGAIN